jgi:hypothetical protein
VVVRDDFDAKSVSDVDFVLTVKSLFCVVCRGCLERVLDCMASSSKTSWSCSYVGWKACINKDMQQ